MGVGRVGRTRRGRARPARALGYADEQMAHATLEGGQPVVLAAHELAWGAQADELDVLADALAAREVVVFDELGCGVVPAEREGRLGRERAGRLNCRLVARATCVVRMVCGIPVVLAGALPQGYEGPAPAPYGAVLLAEHAGGVA